MITLLAVMTLASVVMVTVAKVMLMVGRNRYSGDFRGDGCGGG